MRVALVSEGTYPYAMGGVSVWCDQLIRGLPDYRWQLVPLSVDGGERQVWDQPPNLERVQPIPLWGPAPRGGRRSGRPGEPFAHHFAAFLTSILTPLDPRSSEAAVNRSEFLLALQGLHEYSAAGHDLGDALTSNEALTLMIDAWRSIRAGGLTLADRHIIRGQIGNGQEQVV